MPTNYITPLIHSAKYIHYPLLLFRKSALCPCLFMCFVWSQNMQWIFSYRIKLHFFRIMEIQYIFCELRITLLSITEINCRLQMVTGILNSVLPVKLAAITSTKHLFYSQFVFSVWKINKHMHTYSLTNRYSLIQCQIYSVAVKHPIINTS